MFDNLLIVAILASAVWIGLFVFYLIVSRQHQSLEQDINQLNDLLDETKSQND